MKDLRVPQLRMDSHLRTEDLRVGLATIKASKHQGQEGWTLPGCKFTRNRKEAEHVCKEVNRLIQSNGGIKPFANLRKAA